MTVNRTIVSSATSGDEIEDIIMEARRLEPDMSIHVDDSLYISLGRGEGSGMHIIVLPNRTPSGPVPRPVRLVPIPPMGDDDLADATWEDAEWQ